VLRPNPCGTPRNSAACILVGLIIFGMEIGGGFVGNLIGEKLWELVHERV
jgi:hypothetical protein